MLNYTYLRRDVLTLAHELGHGVHAALGATQGVFHMATPLTLAETASVFGETLVFGRLLDAAPSPESQAVAAGGVDRGLDRDRLPPGGDEPLRAPRAHARGATRASSRSTASASCGRDSQEELLGDAVEVTEGYRSWWSYVPHFIASPGYVYAYAYGQLLALAVYGRYEEEGAGLRRRLPRAAERGRLAARPRSWARSSASTSPTRASGTRAWTSWSASSTRPRQAARDAAAI